MSHVLAGYIFCAEKNLDYGPKLVADLDQSQMTLQPAKDPAAPSNHPAWVFSHLNVYLPIISAALKGELFDDPKDHKFGMQSKPSDDASIYETKEQLVTAYIEGHQAVIDQLKSGDASILDHPIELERWRAFFPTAAVLLPYLLCNHENQHLGQISAWRRIQGMPSV